VSLSDYVDTKSVEERAAARNDLFDHAAMEVEEAQLPLMAAADEAIAEGRTAFRNPDKMDARVKRRERLARIKANQERKQQSRETVAGVSLSDYVDTKSVEERAAARNDLFDHAAMEVEEAQLPLMAAADEAIAEGRTELRNQDAIDARVKRRERLARIKANQERKRQREEEAQLPLMAAADEAIQAGKP